MFGNDGKGVYKHTFIFGALVDTRKIVFAASAYKSMLSFTCISGGHWEPQNFWDCDHNRPYFIHAHRGRSA